MDALRQQVGKGAIDRPLPRHPILADEGGAFDLDGEMGFAARIMPGMATMPFAVVDDGKTGGGKSLG